MNWISVKDRLPEENVSVLVFIPEEDNHITTGMWDVSKKWVLLDEYRIPVSQVTYWHEMILPPEDKSYDCTHEVSEDDTMSTQIRKLQKENYDLVSALKQCKEALERTITGYEWRIENDPMTMDKSDCEHLDDMKATLETINKLGL